MSLSMQKIEKSFDLNRVLKGVDFAVEPGEIRALIGENGAGKTTLMNILGGVLQPDSGAIVLDGKRHTFTTPRQSQDAKIAFIHQELNLVNDLTVYENLFLGRELPRGALLDRRGMIAASAEVLARMDIDLDPRETVGNLDASYKQIVEIARALLSDARVVIMDEPTTSLTETEIERVFKMMRSMRDADVAVVFISHKLREVLTVCDTFTVLRDGEVVRQGDVSSVTELMLANWMVGHDVRTERLNRARSIGAEALRVQRLALGRTFRDISFSLASGEILGFTGLLGDGRSELFQTVFGCNPQYEGNIFVAGRRIHMNSTTTAYRAGIGYVPRDRKENGIAKDMTILENGSLVIYRQLTRLGLIDHKLERGGMQKRIADLSIKLGSMDDAITSLSGGNQQKVVLAKWLGAAPKILVFDNPTQGVDVGAKEEIYDIILRLAESGVAVCILSSEAQEIIRLCDRAIVMYHGAAQGELNESALTERNIMVLATGGSPEGMEGESVRP